jgi:octaprenyl-diphosphate synthase
MSSGKAGQPLTIFEIAELVQDDLLRVEQEIRLESVASVVAITTIGQYLQSSGGKRLRPTLVLLASKLLGGGGDNAIRLGAVVEMIHTATLVHDDIIDEAQTRRGQASTNIKFGNHISVLAGDWLYMQAFQLALRERSFRVLDQLIGVTQRMVEGELLQLSRIGSISVSEADYMELVDRKTAALFSTCARLGAIVAGADESVDSHLGEYAWNLGMAFQLVDDVLDFTAHEDVLGKPVGSDLKEGKVTLPLIYALERADASERELVESVLRDRSYSRVPLKRILELIEKYHGMERVRERAGGFTEKAREIIAAFPDSPYQRAMGAIADLVTDRDH